MSEQNDDIFGEMNREHSLTEAEGRRDLLERLTDSSRKIFSILDRSSAELFIRHDINRTFVLENGA